MYMFAFTIFLSVSPAFSSSVEKMSKSRPAGVCRINRWTKNSAEQAERIKNYYYESLAFLQTLALIWNLTRRLWNQDDSQRHLINAVFFFFDPGTIKVNNQYQETTRKGDVSHFSSSSRMSDALIGKDEDYYCKEEEQLRFWTWKWRRWMAWYREPLVSSIGFTISLCHRAAIIGICGKDKLDERAFMCVVNPCRKALIDQAHTFDWCVSTSYNQLLGKTWMSITSNSSDSQCFFSPIPFVSNCSWRWYIWRWLVSKTKSASCKHWWREPLRYFRVDQGKHFKKDAARGQHGPSIWEQTSYWLFDQ